MVGLDYSALNPYAEEDDLNRFDIQKENGKLIDQAFDEINIKNLEALTTPDFYGLENNGLSFDKLSDKKKAEYGRKNGDIILVNNDEAVYKIDAKISDKFLGAISLGSVVDFDKDC